MYIFAEDYLDDLLRMPTSRKAVRETYPDGSRDAMRTDIRQIGENIQMETELPGYARNEVKLHLKDGYLTIEASREPSQATGRKYLRRERHAGHCSRTFFVGKDLREEDFKARYEAGILIITFPKEVKRAPEEKRYITIEG